MVDPPTRVANKVNLLVHQKNSEHGCKSIAWSHPGKVIVPRILLFPYYYRSVLCCLSVFVIVLLIYLMLLARVRHSAPVSPMYTAHAAISTNIAFAVIINDFEPLKLLYKPIVLLTIWNFIHHYNSSLPVCSSFPF